MQLGDRIKARRAALQLTQQELADRVAARSGARVYQGDVSHWEKGDPVRPVVPPTVKLPALAEVLGVSIDWLLTGAGEQPSEAA